MISSETARMDYEGAGTAGPFVYSFKVFAGTDLLVTKRDADDLETTLVYASDFTATGIGDRDGGTITLIGDVIAVGETLTIRRVRPLTQTTSIRNQGSYRAELHENAFDHLIMIAQQQEDAISRAILLPESVDGTDFDLHLPEPEAGKALVWNATADGLDNATLSDAQLSAWSATHNLTVDRFTGGVDFTAGSSTTLTLSGTPGSEDNVRVVRRTSGTVVEVLHDQYSVVGTTLTFASAIPASTTYIEVTYLLTYQVNRAVSQNVVYAQTGTGSVTRDVRSVLRELHFSAKDFGAVGDGVTDDTAAVQAAIDASLAAKGVCYLPPGTYRITSSLAVTGASFLNPSIDLCIVGAGYGKSLILNQAGASNPAIDLQYVQYFYLADFGIGGDAAHPNDAIAFDQGAFGSFERIGMWPNGKGMVFTVANTIAIVDCLYWPSGYNPGGFGSSGTNRKNGIYYSGTNGNDFHIVRFNAVGVETSANGGAGIRWNMSIPCGGVTLVDCELEGTGVRAVDFKGVYGGLIIGCFVENADLRFLDCRFISIDACAGGATATITVGDGTLGNSCLGIVAKHLNFDEFTADSFSARCGAEHCTFAVGGYNNDSSDPVTNDVAGVGSVLIPNPGYWTDVAYDAANFTADVGTWGVEAGDQVTYSYMMIGKTMFLAVRLLTTSPAGGPNNILSVAIPGGYVAAKAMVADSVHIDIRGGATPLGTSGTASVGVGGSVVNVANHNNGGGALVTFANNVNQTDISFMIAFEVE